MVNQRIVLARRPAGSPIPADFSFQETPLPEPKDGEFVVAHSYIGLQPAARLHMSDGVSYMPATPLNGVPFAQTVGHVTATRRSGFKEGDLVFNEGGWQTHSLVSPGCYAYHIDPQIHKPTLALGCMGPSGLTAYVGLLAIALPKPGETLVVSAATGAVGSVVGQIAKLKGCRVVGIAGNTAKCNFATNELGFDYCINHRSDNLKENLLSVCTEGVDINFENVGGRVRDAVWPLMNNFGRVVLCGLIAEYNETSGINGPSWMNALVRRLRIQGFIVRDYQNYRQEFFEAMNQWISQRQVIYLEDITEGFAKVPTAFIRMLKGKNFGKSIVAL